MVSQINVPGSFWTSSRMFREKWGQEEVGFRGVSVLESEVTESSKLDSSTDEIRRWSSLSEEEFVMGCQCEDV